MIARGLDICCALVGVIAFMVNMCYDNTLHETIGDLKMSDLYAALSELNARRKVVDKAISDIEEYRVPYDDVKLATYKEERDQIDQAIALIAV